MNKNSASQQTALAERSVSSDHAPFNYAELEEETGVFLREQTEAIRDHVRQSMAGLVEIGRRLISVKKCLEHGRFQRWLRAEFPWSVDTAENYMGLARLVDQNPNGSDFLSQLTPGAAYLLASRNIPEHVVSDVIARAERGERITRPMVRQTRLLAAQSGAVSGPSALLTGRGEAPAVGDREHLRYLKASVAVARALLELLEREYNTRRAQTSLLHDLIDQGEARHQAWLLREDRVFTQRVDALLTDRAPAEVETSTVAVVDEDEAPEEPQVVEASSGAYLGETSLEQRAPGDHLDDTEAAPSEVEASAAFSETLDEAPEVLTDAENPAPGLCETLLEPRALVEHVAG